MNKSTANNSGVRNKLEIDDELQVLLNKREISIEDLQPFCPEREMSESERQLYSIVRFFRHSDKSAGEAKNRSSGARRDLARIIYQYNLDFEQTVRPILVECGEVPSRISEMATIAHNTAALKAFLNKKGFQRALDQARGITDLDRRGKNFIKAWVNAGSPPEFLIDDWHIKIERAPEKVQPVKADSPGPEPASIGVDWEEQLRNDLDDEIKNPGKPRTPVGRKVVC